jgi:hypothetical protein
MSESSFPFGGSAEMEPQADPAQDGDSRKPLLLVGGLVGALVLGAGAFLLLGGGGADDSDEFALVPRAAGPVAEAPAAEPLAVAVIPAASTDQVGRNPFKARYVEPAAASAPEAPAAVTPVAAVETLPLPLLPPQQPVQIVVQQAPAEQQAAAEYPITLKSVEPTGPSGITYTWTIDGKDISVFQAQRFGKYGELVVLALESAEDGPKAVLQVGDATPIRVKVGETVNVL